MDEQHLDETRAALGRPAQSSQPDPARTPGYVGYVGRVPPAPSAERKVPTPRPPDLGARRPINAVVAALGGALLGAALERVAHRDAQAAAPFESEDQSAMHSHRFDADPIPPTSGRPPSVPPYPHPAEDPEDPREPLLADGQRTIELREEQLVAHKHVRELGEVQIRTVVEEVPSQLTVEALREEVDVEHVPIGQVVGERVAPWEENGALIVPVYEEQLVVVKRLVLKEHLRVRRVATKETQVFEDTVRRDRLVVDDPTGTGLVHERFPTDELLTPSDSVDQRPAREEGRGDYYEPAEPVPPEAVDRREVGPVGQARQAEGGFLESLVKKALR